MHAFCTAVARRNWLPERAFAESNMSGTLCNNPMIGIYNNYHLSPNGILSGNRRRYGLVYLVDKKADSPRARPRKQ